MLADAGAEGAFFSLGVEEGTSSAVPLDGGWVTVVGGGGIGGTGLAGRD